MLNNNLSNENDTLKKIFEDSDYLQKNIEAFQFLKVRDYQMARNSYKECVNIARLLDDDYKFSDSLTNYGITQFFSGKIKDSVDSLETAFRLSLKIFNYQEKNKMILHIKILSNLTLAYLAIGRLNEALNYTNNLIETIKQEKENSNKILYFKNVLNIFFRVESLVNYVNIYHKYSFNIKEKVQVPNENSESEEIHRVIINRILFFLHKYLREGDLDSWIKCLSEEGENFKMIKDYNGFVFAIFNQYVSLYVKNAELNSAQAKMRIQSLCKILIGDKEKSDLEEKDADKILIEMSNKMSTASEIYKKLLEFENVLIASVLIDTSVSNVSCLSNDYSDISGIVLKNSNSSKVFVKIFLRHAMNVLNQMDEDLSNGVSIKQIDQMKIQIKITLELIENNQLDLNSFQMFKMDPEITNSLNVLFENLLFIRYKCKLRRYMKEFMYGTLGYRSREELSYIKEKKYENFLYKSLKNICEGKFIIFNNYLGNILTKINFSTSGKKEHFYMIDLNEEAIKVYEKKNDKKFKIIYFKDIKKFCYGINSNNLRKKFKSMQSSQLNAPWLFFSIITKKRSVDLYLEEGQLMNWFYGLKKFLKEKDSPYKMISVNNFVLTRTKLKLINKLKEEYIKNKNNVLDVKFKQIINELVNGMLKYI